MKAISVFSVDDNGNITMTTNGIGAVTDMDLLLQKIVKSLLTAQGTNICGRQLWHISWRQGVSCAYGQ